MPFFSVLCIFQLPNNLLKVNHTIEMKSSKSAQYEQMLTIAIQEARKGLDEGGIPIGAALFHNDGTLLGKGRNRRIQNNDPSLHGETDAFRKDRKSVV